MKVTNIYILVSLSNMMYKVGREFPFQLYIGLYSIKELFVVFIKIFLTFIFTSTFLV